MKIKKFKSDEINVKDILTNQKITDEEASEIFQIFIKTKKKNN